MKWSDNLSKNQMKAVTTIDKNVMLLAGPGTGKTLTLTRKIAYLVGDKGVDPASILVLTFTRAAAFELQKRVIEILGDQKGKLVHISTLHSFALRQLLLNSSKLNGYLPQPIRIADDWEEREIIQKGLKLILNYSLSDVKEKFNLLSADWQTLEYDSSTYKSIDPKFLGAWMQHRDIYGYILRAELVFQLKKALEQIKGFSLESNFLYLLIDEYQDLNHCDLAVIKALSERNNAMKIFAFGDDDQSIYGFRHAYPDGIRRFEEDFKPAEVLHLDTCIRCDKSIVELSSFVVRLDSGRIGKQFKPRQDAKEGEVHILQFDNQRREAKGIAKICKYLIDEKHYKPGDILILMRSDKDQNFSLPIREEIESKNIKVSLRKSNKHILESNNFRILLSFLHLLENKNDSLAIWTLLDVVKGIGRESLFKIYELALDKHMTFSEAARVVAGKPNSISYTRNSIGERIEKIDGILVNHQSIFNSLSSSVDTDMLINAISKLAEDIIEEKNDRKEAIAYFEQIIKETSSTDLEKLLRALSSPLKEYEQELDPESVNIMTMHRAKGLTAKAVIIAGAEDERIPGDVSGEKEMEELRLLYVSLTRAKHFLVITYCNERTGSQSFLRRNGRTRSRTLSKFLRYAPVKSENGADFTNKLFR